MNALKLTTAILAGSLLVGCAGRAPNPVAMTQTQDGTASCSAMRAEIAANNEKRADLHGEQIGKNVQNFTAGLIGAFIWPVLFAADVQDAPHKESNALEDRNLYLAKIANDRCPAEAETAVLTK